MVVFINLREKISDFESLGILKKNCNSSISHISHNKISLVDLFSCEVQMTPSAQDKHF